MKAVVLVAVICLLSGANAGFLDGLKSVFQGITDTGKQVVTAVTPTLQTLGTQLTDLLKTTGSQILSQGLAGLMSGINSLGTGTGTGTGTPATGTRDLDLAQGMASFMEKGKNVVDTLSHNMVGTYISALEEYQKIAHKIGSLEFLKEPVQNIIDQIEKVPAVHSLLQDHHIKDLVTDPLGVGKDIASHLLAKIHLRQASTPSLTDTVKSIGSSLSSVFSPLKDLFTTHITNLGNTLKGAVSGVKTLVTPVLNNLKTALSGHIATLGQGMTELVGHGKNALSALQAAVTDIMQTTLSNAKPTLSKILSTGKDAVSTAANTLTGGSS